MRWSMPAAALVMALSGCFGFFGECGYQLEAVAWQDAEFGALLQGVQGWNVSVDPPGSGLPHANAQITAWGASIQSASIQVADNQDLYMDRSHGLALWGVAVPPPEGLRESVQEALSQLTDGSASEAENWTDALFSSPRYMDYGRHGESWEEPERTASYEYRLDPARVDLDAVLEGHVPAEPTARIDTDTWSVHLEFPRATAYQGPLEFVAESGGSNEFRNVQWFDDGTDEQAMRDFAAAYESLGVGPVPSDAGPYGSIC